MISITACSRLSDGSNKRDNDLLTVGLKTEAVNLWPFDCIIDKGERER